MRRGRTEKNENEDRERDLQRGRGSEISYRRPYGQTVWIIPEDDVVGSFDSTVRIRLLGKDPSMGTWTSKTLPDNHQAAGSVVSKWRTVK